MITAYAMASGRNHLKDNACCQDNIDIRILKDSLVFAIADGAGSAASSLHGSELAVKTFCESLSKSTSLFPDNTCLIAAFDDARKALEKEANKRCCSIKDLHTTLFGGIYLKGNLKCAGIGDSMCFVVEKDGEVLIPVQPTKGEFINETIFITSEYWKDFLKVSDLIENPKSLVACSDGLLNIIYSTVFENGIWKLIPHKDVIENMMDYIAKNHVVIDINKEIADMLRGDRANDLNNDDKALVVAIFNETNRE